MGGIRPPRKLRKEGVTIKKIDFTCVLYFKPFLTSFPHLCTLKWLENL